MKLLSNISEEMINKIFFNLSKNEKYKEWKEINLRYFNIELTGTFQLALDLPKNKKIIYYNELLKLLNENSK